MGVIVPCPVCSLVRETNKSSSSGSLETYKCERCGIFSAEREVFDSISTLPPATRRHIIRWLREPENEESIDTPKISADMISRWSKTPAIRVSEMAELYLKDLVSSSNKLGASFNVFDLSAAKACDAFDEEELPTLARYLNQQGFVVVLANGGAVEVTAKGFEHISDGAYANIDSNQAFVAMWFNRDLNEIFDLGFARAIIESGFDVLRIDKKEHNRKIDDEIIAELRRSRFVVADFTGHRGGVYYEAGFAAGLGIPVIWTCRKDHLPELHFDIRQYNCVEWESAEELCSKLRNRIIALLGVGRNSVKS